jgi:hypothetical protein
MGSYRTRLLIVVAAAAFAIYATAAFGEDKRVALVIGNSAYQNTAQLNNPRNDAADLGAALRKLKFDVIEGLDLDKAGMDQTIRQFARALGGADVGLFFYAGHGLQVAGQNYLVPVDAKLEDASGLDFELLRLDLVHKTMERETNTSLLFIDACRDNPLSRNLARAMGTRAPGIGRGLAAVESGVGTLIAFSTQPGNFALDGEGRNSPFAGALVKRIPTPGEDLSSLLIAVRNDVMAATRNRQVPWEHSALRSRFYFRAPEPAVSADQAAEEVVWAAAKDSKSSVLLKTYLQRYPKGDHAISALALIEQLEKEEAARTALALREAELRQAEEAKARAELAWSKASGANRLTDYEAYLAAWPEGTHAADARNLVDRLKDLRSRWQTLASSRNLPDLADFVHTAAGTEFGLPAQVRLAELSRSEREAWEVADKLQTVVGYRRFFSSWPDGYYKDAAAARITTLEKIAAEWEVLKSSDNEASLEAFITEHGWSEPGAEAVARLVALRRERQHPSRDNIVVLTAREVAAAMDGKDVELVGSGVIIRFDSRSTPPFRKALGQDFLKSIVKEDVVILEGAFSATPGSDAHASRIEGLAAVVQSRVDNTGSLFLIQMHGSERLRRDVDQKDRLHSALSIIRSPYGYVCVQAQWSLMLAGEPSRKLSENCRFAAK